MDKAKEKYKTYLADDEISPLSKRIVKHILLSSPTRVLEFGCGTGKNLKHIRENEHKYALSNIRLVGIDVSLLNIIYANVKNDLPYVFLGDQDILPMMQNIDVVFTVSVLDHIEFIDDIIKEFKRIAKRVYLAEPLLDKPSDLYWAHDYKKFGFTKMDFEWKSNGDGNTYYLWEWVKVSGEQGNSFSWPNEVLK